MLASSHRQSIKIHDFSDEKIYERSEDEYLLYNYPVSAYLNPNRTKYSGI